MTLHATAKVINYEMSIRKFLVDNLQTIEGIELLWDITVPDPDLLNQMLSFSKWVAINLGDMDRGEFSRAFFEMYLTTRNDPDGLILTELSDTVMGYLSDTDVPHGMKRIQFYETTINPNNAALWTSIGGILVQDVTESGRIDYGDGLKYKILTVVTRFASKV